MRRRTLAWMVVAVVIVVAPAAAPVGGWTEEIHTNLAALSYRFLGRPSGAGGAGGSVGGGVAHVDAAALEDGSVEPDKGRGRRWWLNDSHKTDAARIYNAWKSAFPEFASNENPIPPASNRVGRAIHYVQDQTELADELRRGIYETFNENSRTFGEVVLAALKDAGPSRFPAYTRRLEERDAAYRRLRWPEITAEIPLIQREFDADVSAALKDRADEKATLEQTRTKVRQAYERYFAGVVALQNQIIRLYHVKAEEALALRANFWAGDWRVRSEWDSYPERNTTWDLTVFTQRGRTFAKTTNGVFLCTTTASTLDFTDDSNRVHRIVRVHLERRANGTLFGSFTGRGRDNLEITGRYVPRRKSWPTVVIE